MKVINRIIETQITNLLESNKVILILGTRRVGKTFLINSKELSIKTPFSEWRGLRCTRSN